MERGEIRQNKATRQWVIYSPARRKRPRDFQAPYGEREGISGSAHEPGCPFCPGNDDLLPRIIMETHGTDGAWRTRVVPNKFPALVPEGDTARFASGIYVTMNGYGRHEVVVESPFHDRHMARMSSEEVYAVIETYHARYRELMREHENMMTIIFRNHGKRAGTSLIHPHSQIIVTAIVPHHVRSREEEAQRYFDEWGRCVYCDIMEFEMKERTRVIQENGSFVAFVPFAAEVPFELWIVPKTHCADFGSVSDAERHDLASILREALLRLYRKLGDPDYNYVINTAARFRADEPQLHWYLHIHPRLTTRAGFEIGSGISINPSMPEDDAAFLREGTPEQV